MSEAGGTELARNFTRGSDFEVTCSKSWFVFPPFAEALVPWARGRGALCGKQGFVVVCTPKDQRGLDCWGPEGTA